MEIRDQMTATVRLTKQAAQRLSVFLEGLKTQPKNMNDALNLALSDLPVASFIDELSALQKDERKSLIEINDRFRSTGFLKRADYYFMILMAKRAAWTSKKEQVRHESIQAALEMTLDLWDLCKDRDKAGHQERYMLGNVSGSRSDEKSHALVTHIPAYIEQSKKHPYPATLEFALRNPEVMLRDDVTNIDDTIINQKMHKYYDVLYGMAVRCLYLETKQPLTASENQDYFKPNFSGNFGPNHNIHFIHDQNKNFSFMVTFRREISINIAANNIVEAEEFIVAFTTNKKEGKSYKGELFSLIHTDDDSYFKGGFIFQTRMIQMALTRAEYDEVSEAIIEMLADTRIQVALKETYERYGTI
jgi:hypothetical protein